MKLEIVERPAHTFWVCYGDQVVGEISRHSLHGWQYHIRVLSWDHFNPVYVQRLKAMVDDKIKLLTITDKLTG